MFPDNNRIKLKIHNKSIWENFQVKEGNRREIKIFWTVKKKDNTRGRFVLMYGKTNTIL